MSNTEAPFSVTFRNSGNYDAYLFTVRGDTAAELEERLDRVVEKLLQKVEDTALLAGAVHTASAPSQPEPAAAAPAASADESKSNVSALKTCQHGVRERKSGRSSKGPWVGYFCPQPKNASDKCDPIWE